MDLCVAGQAGRNQLRATPPFVPPKAMPPALPGSALLPGSSRPLPLTPGVGGSAEDDDDRLCVVCMEKAASVLLAPCGHTVLCLRCCEGIRVANNQVGGAEQGSWLRNQL